jgi:DNA-binding NarL/FixJ family response regulator
MMVDDEPLIRKIVKMEMNERAAHVESGDLDASVLKEVEMVDTFGDGGELLAALENLELPNYLLVDMEFHGEPTGGLYIARRVHERYPGVRIIIFSGRFDAPLPGEEGRLERLHDVGRVVMEALRIGASAFVSKNATGGFSVENILRAIACLERGERFYFNYPVMLTLKEAAERYFDIVADHDFAFSLSEQERQLLLLEAAGCTASEISDRLGETDKAIQERQKGLSQRLGIVNKSASRVAKAFALGLIAPSEVNFLPRS